MDALAAAERHPDREVIFFGIGFETTAPAVTLAIQEAKARGLRNFSVLQRAQDRFLPRSPRSIASDLHVDGFLCPGHVSVIIGSDAYRPTAAAGKPCVVAGFEPADILRSIEMLLRQLAEGRSEVEVEYSRAVRPEGNRKAQELMARDFRVVDAAWRGIGVLPGSGLDIAEDLADFDAARRFAVDLPPTKEPAGCRCGDVLCGRIEPHDCPLFGTTCTPTHPVGACMVSTEGACQAHYRYRSN